MIKKEFKYSEETVQKILFGLVNLGNIAIIWFIVTVPAMLHGLSRALNPPTGHPPTLGDRFVDAVLFPWSFSKYVVLVGSIAAMASSFLASERKDKLFFGVVSVVMIIFAVFLMGLGRELIK